MILFPSPKHRYSSYAITSSHNIQFNHVNMWLAFETHWSTSTHVLLICTIVSATTSGDGLGVYTHLDLVWCRGYCTWPQFTDVILTLTWLFNNNKNKHLTVLSKSLLVSHLKKKMLLSLENLTKRAHHICRCIVYCVKKGATLFSYLANLRVPCAVVFIHFITTDVDRWWCYRATLWWVGPRLLCKSCSIGHTFLLTAEESKAKV